MEMSLRDDCFKGAFGKRMAGVAVLIVLTAGMAGCKTADSLNPSETLHEGYVLDPESLAFVPVGSSREQVMLTLGTPSITATFDNEVFYYISQTRKRSVAFMNPRIVDRHILAVYFGKDDRVARIANYGLKDGRVFDFISRTTPTGGKEESFVGQLLSSVKSGKPPVNPFGGS